MKRIVSRREVTEGNLYSRLSGDDEGPDLGKKEQITDYRPGHPGTAFGSVAPSSWFRLLTRLQFNSSISGVGAALGGRLGLELLPEIS